MRKHQRGITAIGWLILLAPLAIVIYAGVRLLPIYLNYMNVAHSLEAVTKEYTNSGAGSADGVRNAVFKHFQVESIEYPSDKDLKITRIDGIWTIEANYDDQAPLFANMAILVSFDKTVQLKDGPGE